MYMECIRKPQRQDLFVKSLALRFQEWTKKLKFCLSFPFLYLNFSFQDIVPPPPFFKENLQILSFSLTGHHLNRFEDIIFFFNINTHLKIHMLVISYILKDD